MRSRLPVSAGSWAMIRDISAMRRFVVIDRGQQLRQQRRPPRDVFGTRLDALENLLDRREHWRVVGLERSAQGLARCIVERVRDEAPQRLTRN